MLQALLVACFGLRGFSYRRDFSVKDAQVGDTVRFVEVIRNRSLLFLPWIRIESRIPPSFEFHTKEEVDIRGSNYHQSVFSLPPFCQITRQHRVVLRSRGHFQLTQAAMTAGDLLGIRTISRDIDAPAELFVYPASLPLEQALLPFSRPQGSLAVPRWIQPDPFLVNGIRAYRAGDPERDIHWASTARTGELQVKTHDYTADPRLMVLINAQKTPEQWGDLMEYEQDRIEYAISLAATLCQYALSRGAEAGFAANMPLDENEEAACLPPARSADRAEVLLRAMACLRIKRLVRFSTFLEQLPAQQGIDYVILSCYDSEDIRARMESLRRRGNTASLRVLPEVHHG